MSKHYHPFHLVDPSPWPFLVSFSLLQTTLSFVLYLQNFKYSSLKMHLGLIFLLLFSNRWFLDIVRESTHEGHHTLKVQHGLRSGVALFIVSELCFFFSFFWAFFHSSVHPTVAIGCVWPPVGIQTLNPLSIPLLNTLILLSSGVVLTYAHRAILCGYKAETIDGLIGTVIYGVIFTIFQIFEYTYAPFSIQDSVYGSLFFMCTGFHGFHVFIGTLLLIACLIRTFLDHFTKDNHIGFEAAAWYWHFVDGVGIKKVFTRFFLFKRQGRTFGNCFGAPCEKLSVIPLKFCYWSRSPV